MEGRAIKIVTIMVGALTAQLEQDYGRYPTLQRTVLDDNGSCEMSERDVLYIEDLPWSSATYSCQLVSIIVLLVESDTPNAV